MQDFSLEALEQFIVRAKQSTYVGSGKESQPSRLKSHDLQFVEGPWLYHDSYLGESDFIGEEIVYYNKTPVWGMNYFGTILKADKITSAQAGTMIKQSLSRMYSEGRFLGDFTHTAGDLTYRDQSDGDLTWFRGREEIVRDGEVVYELFYHGGLIRP